MKSVVELIRELPPDLQQEVRDFAQYLLDRKTRPDGRKLQLSWAGGLREFSSQYTALELQEKALQWRGD